MGGGLARVKAPLAQGKAADAGALIPDELLDMFAFSGTAEQVAVQARRLIEQGGVRYPARPERGPRCRPARDPGPSAARPLTRRARQTRMCRSSDSPWKVAEKADPIRA
jgi:5,10-methylenetetrahydromethanopterin reductase